MGASKGAVSGQTTPSSRFLLDLSPIPPSTPAALDTEQAQVVAHRKGPLLVLAGPGTGKTTTIVEAVAARLSDPDKPLAPSEILVLTFGKRAAGELRDRLVARIGGGLVPTVATFHSFAYGVIRETADDYLLSPRLMSGAEEDVRIRELLLGSVEDGVIEWPDDLAAALSTLGFANEVRAVLARAAGQGITPDRLREIAASSGIPAWSAIGHLARQEQDVADFEEVMTYSELLELASDRLAIDSIAATYHARYRAIYVDEYQDTDPAQVRFLAALAGPGTAVVAVGDPDQAIYGFRGAELRGILEFPQTFTHADGSPAEVIVLRNTRRFGRAIRDAARVVIGDRLHAGLPVEQQRLHRNPQLADEEAECSPVRVTTYDGETSRAIHVAREIREMNIDHELDWSQMAVLVRTGGQLAAVQRALLADGIPVAVAADEIPLRGEPAVAALLQVVRLCAHPRRIRPADAADALSGPMCGLDATDIRRIGRVRRQSFREENPGAPVPPSEDLLAAMLVELISGDATSISIDADRIDRQLQAFGTLLRRAHLLVTNGARPEEVLWSLWCGDIPGGHAHGWPNRLRTAALHGSRTADHDLDAVMALFETAERASDRRAGVVGIDVFLKSLDDQHIAAEPVAERAARSDAVRLLTVHRAKGLEWDAVWVVGAEEGLWPDLRARGSLLQAEQLTPEGLGAAARASEILAEERRLFYVAITRARTYLTIATIDAKAGEGDRPSRFIAEMQAAGVVVTIPCTVRPRFRLSLDGLVAELREVLINPDSTPELIEAAASRLAALGQVRDSNGFARVPLADPAQWWSTRELTAGTGPVRSLEKPVGLSGSGLESVLECPLSWFLAKEAKAETPSPPSTRFGSVVHAVADFIGKEQLPADLDSVDSYIDRIWHELRFEAPWQSQADRAEARVALSRFIDYHLRHDRELVGTELGAGATLTVPAPDGTTYEVVLGGSIDRLERDMQGNLVVIDLKNMKTPPPNTEIPEHGQLGVYQLFVREHGIDGDPEGGVGGAGLVQLRKAESSKSNAPQVQMQAPLPSESPTWVELKLGEAAEVIRSENFEARPNKFCERCVYRTACPAQSEGLPVIT